MSPQIFIGLNQSAKQSMLKRYSSFKGNDVPDLLPTHIMSKGSEYFNIKESLIVSPTKEGNVANARQQIIYAIKTLCNISLSETAKMFNRHHSTIIYSIDTVKDIYSTDKKYRIELDAFLNHVTNNL